MTEEKLTEGYYAGVFYTINEDGTRYSVFEYTPVIRAKHEIGCGATVEKGKYTDEYVRKAIDEILDNVDLTVEKAKEEYYVQLRLPLEYGEN